MFWGAVKVGMRDEVGTGKRRGRSRDEVGRGRRGKSTGKDEIGWERRDKSRDEYGRRGKSRDEYGRHGKSRDEYAQRHKSRDGYERRGMSRDTSRRRGRSRDEEQHQDRSRSKKRASSHADRSTKRTTSKHSSDDDSSSSDDEDVEERYCRACELALPNCRHRHSPDMNARLDWQKYFISPPVCYMHFRSKEIVKDDELVTLEDLWKDMKAREPCRLCDAARKFATPVPFPYDTAKTEGEKYFMPPPFCLLHGNREDILYEDELISVKKYYRVMKKKEVCFTCERHKGWSRPLQGPNDRAFTEGERWFSPSPLCLRHKDRRKILQDGEMVKMEDFWKIRVEAERKAAKVAKKQEERKRDDAVLSDGRGRTRDTGKEAKSAQKAPDLLSPNYAAPQRHHSRGRPRSTVDPLRDTDDIGSQNRRRPRSVDVPRSYEGNRKSRSPSPFPLEWTTDQKEKYLQGFRTLAQPPQEPQTLKDRTAQFPPPPPPPLTGQYEHQAPQASAGYHAHPSVAPSTAFHGFDHNMTAGASANVLSPRSAMSDSYRGTDGDHDSGSDGSDDSFKDCRGQKQGNRSLVERLGILSPPS